MHAVFATRNTLGQVSGLVVLCIICFNNYVLLNISVPTFGTALVVVALFNSSGRHLVLFIIVDKL